MIIDQYTSSALDGAGVLTGCDAVRNAICFGGDVVELPFSSGLGLARLLFNDDGTTAGC